MNKTLLVVITIVVAGALGFYGGMKYGQGSSSQSSLTQGGQRNFGNGTASGTGSGRRGGLGQNGGFAGGDIISRDDKSITVKLGNGGSKIIFVSDTTQVMKAVAGSLVDLTVGEQVTVNGSANSDGSITAQSVQVRPASSTVR